MKSANDLAALYPEHLATMMGHAQAALSAAKADRLAIFAGEEQVSFRDDWHYPFKPNPHFLAWVPLTEHPYCWLLIEPGERPRLLYYQPDDYWHQPPADPNGFWVEHFEIDILRSPEQAKQALGELSNTALVAPSSATSLFNDWGFASHNHDLLINTLEYERAAKTHYELSCMRSAQTIAVRCHLAAERAFRLGASEYEIHQAYLGAAQLQDGQLPYSSIVGLNEHGAVLHYQHLDRKRPADSRSFLIDAGACFNGYAADITRSYSRREDQFADLIHALDEAQRTLCDTASAGVDYRDLHLQSHHAIASILQAFDLVQMEPDSIVDTGISSTFFPHGIGHLIGLQTHDCGGFLAGPDGSMIDKPAGHPFLRLTRVLEPGFVITIEPGLYFIPPLLSQLRENRFARAINWPKVEQMLPFGGVRIEDDVAVTVERPENLTRLAFAAAS